MSFTKTKTRIQLSTNFSSNIDKDLFYFRKVCQFGSSSSPTCTAFEPLQGLLAVGFADGVIKVFGKSNFEISLKCATCLNIKGLVWDSNEGRLAAFGDDSILYIWNLKSHEICLENFISLDQMKSSKRLSTIKFEFPISCVASFPGQKPFFVGCIDGEAYVVNWTSGKVSPSKIHCMASMASSLVNITIHPYHETKLFLAYESGLIVLFDLVDGKIIKKYNLDSNLKTFSLDPSAKYFCCGYSDGQYAIWETKNDKKPACIRKLCNSKRLKPIIKVLWYQNGNSNFLLILGGNDYSEPSSFQIIRYDKNDFSQIPNSQQIFFHGETITDFFLFPSNLWNYSDPIGVSLLKEGSLEFRQLDLPDLLPLNISPSLNFGFLNFKSHLIVLDYPDELIDDILSCASETEEGKEFILGGFPLKSPLQTALILLATDTKIYFCQGIPFGLKIISIFDLAKIDEDFQKYSIKSFDFCPQSRKIFIQFESGEVLLTEFTFESGFEYKVLTIEDKVHSDEKPAKDLLSVDQEKPKNLPRDKSPESHKQKSQDQSRKSSPLSTNVLNKEENAEQEIKASEEIQPDLKIDKVDEPSTNEQNEEQVNPEIEVIDDHFDRKSTGGYSEKSATPAIVERYSFDDFDLVIENRSALMFPGFNPKTLISSKSKIGGLAYDMALNNITFQKLDQIYNLDLGDLKIDVIMEHATNAELCYSGYFDSYILSSEEIESVIGLFGFQDGSLLGGYCNWSESPVINEIVKLKEADGDSIIFATVLNSSGKSAKLPPSDWTNDLLTNAEKFKSRSSINSASSEKKEIAKALEEEKHKQKKKGLSKIFSKKPESDQKSSHDRHYLVVATKNNIFVHVDCSDRVAAQVNCPNIVKCQVMEYDNSCFLCCLTADLSLMIYTLPSLHFVHLVPIGSALSSKNLKEIILDTSGYILSKGAKGSFSLLDILSSENRLLDSTSQKVLLHSNLLELPARPTGPNEGWFSSMFSKPATKIFGAKPSVKEERKSEQVQKDIAEGQNTFRQTHQALEERGERLRALDSKTADLAESSKGFADLAKRVREKHEKKKWYQL